MVSYVPLGLFLAAGYAAGRPFWVASGCAALVLLFLYSVWHILWRTKIRSTYYVATSAKDVSVPLGTERSQKKVCVIGGGASGIVTTKELLDEGHQVTCYEKYDDIGGVFFYADHKGGVYDSTVLTASNFLMAFSDFPPDGGDKYRFWHHSEYNTYLKRYIEQFRLQSRSRLITGMTVVKVVKNGDKWRVTVAPTVPDREPNSKQEVVEDYDAVAVCNGANQASAMPSYAGQETSPILFCHAESYKNAKGDPRFQGKRVVCVGVGETGADISAECAEVASKVWLSMRRGPTIVSRNQWNLHLPGDVFTSRSMFYCNPRYLERLHYFDGWLKKITSGKIGQFIFRGNLGLGDPVTAKIAELADKSGGGVGSQFLTKSDKFVPYILDGRIIEKPTILHIEGRTVHFIDGTKVENVDTVICATGYQPTFPFLPDLKIKSIRELYKHAFHPDIGTSMAFIGFVRPSSGGVPFCSELVARYWSLILSNQRKLPDDWKERQKIERDLEEKALHLSGLTSLVLWGEWIESMASHIGCSPRLLMHLFTNPLFWVQLYYGPMVPVQFRLRGPHAKPDLAKKVIYSLPVATPPPFALAQSCCAVMSWIGGILFGVLPPGW